MIRLYCYHAPAYSTVGFQTCGWELEKGVYTAFTRADGTPQAWKFLLEGGCKALCTDTVAGTRLFVLRDIHTQTERCGWHLNFVLETDAEDQPLLSGMILALLVHSEETLQRFAGLFSVVLSGGERYELDADAFTEMLTELRDAGNAADFSAYLQTLPASDFREKLTAFDRLLHGETPLAPGSIHLLVSSVTEHYFFGKTTVSDLRRPPVLSMTEAAWDAVLAQKEDAAEIQKASEEEVSAAQDPEPGFARRIQRELPDPGQLTAEEILTAAVIAGGTALAVFGACTLLRSVIDKRTRKQKRGLL